MYIHVYMYNYSVPGCSWLAPEGTSVCGIQPYSIQVHTCTLYVLYMCLVLQVTTNNYTNAAHCDPMGAARGGEE